MTGKMFSYVANYPTEAGQAGANAAGSGQGTGELKYPFTVDITSEIGDLKQAFLSVNTSKSSTIHPVPVKCPSWRRSKLCLTIEAGKAKKSMLPRKWDAENR